MESNKLGHLNRPKYIYNTTNARHINKENKSPSSIENWLNIDQTQLAYTSLEVLKNNLNKILTAHNNKIAPPAHVAKPVDSSFDQYMLNKRKSSNTSSPDITSQTKIQKIYKSESTEIKPKLDKTSLVAGHDDEHSSLNTTLSSISCSSENCPLPQNQVSKSDIYITSFDEEINNTYPKINFNEITPSAYHFRSWKFLIQTLKTKKHLINYALAKGPLDFNTLDETVEYLKKSPASSEVEKVWLIFVWITEHIAYDDESYRLQKSSYTEPHDIFWKLKCTCEGFAMFFKYLCNRLGFECIRISGYSKGANFNTDKQITRTDHSWNAVKIDGRWEYVDCTWGVGYTKENPFLPGFSEFIKKMQPFYFLTPPQFFIYDHFSKDYQLQAEKITLDEFRRQPKYEVFYHMYELECLTHRAADIVTTANLVTLKFKCPNTTQVIAKLQDSQGTKVESGVVFGRNPVTNNYEINVAVPKSRTKYTLIVYAKYTRDTEKPYKEVGRFTITLNGPHENYELVRVINPLNEKTFAHTPLTFNLDKRECHKFKIFSRHACALALIESDSNRVHFRRDLTEPDTWHLEHCFEKAGRVCVMAQTSLYGNFKEICAYNVV